MPANPLTGYFLVPPSIADALSHEVDVRARAAALRKENGRSKLERVVPTISVYLKETELSLELICAELLARHQIKVHKSTLSRFLQSRPVLSSLRDHKGATDNKTGKLERP
jgi:IS30 family transposase